ncbi:MAG: glycosyltransferase family 2 protein [Acidimicrobiales bacterium]
MSAAAPRLTIGLPVRNGAAYLERCLTSLLDQDFSDLVVIVSDNASTDDTSDIARDIARSDPRVRYRRQPVDVGANANFNDTFRGCNTELFKWAAVDDLIAPRLLSACVDALDADADAVLAYGKPHLIDETDVVLSEPLECVTPPPSAHAVERFAEVLAHEVWCTPIFGVIRADTLRRTKLLRPFYGADKVLLAELSLVGRFACVEPEFFRRCHENQSTVLDARGKATWTTGRRRAGRVPAVVHAVRAYTEIAAKADLEAKDRVRALAAIARLSVAGDKWRKLLLPGPYNYLGWRGQDRSAAYAKLDLRPTGVQALAGAEHRANCNPPAAAEAPTPG